VLLRTSLGFFG